MVINIFRTNALAQREAVSQSNIDYWCRECQYSFAKDKKRCRSKALIQRCWNETSKSTASEWHRQHECPFIHLGQECRCNDYPHISDAFMGAGLHRGQYK